MDEQKLRELLANVHSGAVPVDSAVAQLRRMPIESLGHTQIDTHRALRCGAEEVVFAEGKSELHLLDIVRAHLERSGRVLVTRIRPAQADALDGAGFNLQYDGARRIAWSGTAPQMPHSGSVLGLVSAGTSDASVADEAECTARYFGCTVRRVNDAGVAGLHRLLGALPNLFACRVIIVVAGMDGALASVVSGLVAAPVVAVPTSVGYGAAFEGLAPLLSMLVSCAPGVSVVNIDNGFGAAMAALRMVAVPQRAAG